MLEGRIDTHGTVKELNSRVFLKKLPMMSKPKEWMSRRSYSQRTWLTLPRNKKVAIEAQLPQNRERTSGTQRHQKNSSRKRLAPLEVLSGRFIKSISRLRKSFLLQASGLSLSVDIIIQILHGLGCHRTHHVASTACKCWGKGKRFR
jgi:hypothetical protein